MTICVTFDRHKFNLRLKLPVGAYKSGRVVAMPQFTEFEMDGVTTGQVPTAVSKAKQTLGQVIIFFETPFHLLFYYCILSSKVCKTLLKVHQYTVLLLS